MTAYYGLPHYAIGNCWWLCSFPDTAMTQVAKLPFGTAALNIWKRSVPACVLLKNKSVASGVSLVSHSADTLSSNEIKL